MSSSVTATARPSEAVEAATRRVIDTYRLLHSEEVAEQIRPQVEKYLDTLFSAGETDADRLSVFALTYLKEKDPTKRGFTGM
jgi:hypothetical protein